MPLLSRKKLILAKIETVYGTDSVPTGAANAILAKNIKLDPMLGEDVSRELDQPYFGAQPTIAAGLHHRLTFEVELVPSGSPGVAPAWGVLLRMCAMAQTIAMLTSVTYNPVTDTHESGTIHMWHDGVRFVLLGARGSVKFKIDAQGIPVMEFVMQGLWQAATDVAMAVPTYTAFQQPIIASRTNTPVFTLNAVSLALKSFVLDVANDLQNRFLIGQNDQVLIIDRAPMLEMLVEGDPMATFNPFTLARDSTTMAMAIQHGTAAGRRATLNAARMQLQRPDSPSDDQGRVMWPLKGVALPTTGNDDFTLVLT